MKYFVLVYDRPRREVEIREFEPSELEAADSYRLEQQKDTLRSGADREIVLFQAESRDALKETHGSYFYSPQQLAERFHEAARAS